MLRPVLEVGVPAAPRGGPAVAAPLEPVGLVIARVAQMREAPARAALVESLPGPLDDDQRAAGPERRGEAIDDHADVVDVMQRAARHDRAERLERLELLEAGLLEARARRRVRIDADGLVAELAEARDEATERPAAEIEHPRGSRREVRLHEGPKGRHPALADRHAQDGRRRAPSCMRTTRRSARASEPSRVRSSLVQPLRESDAQHQRRRRARRR